MVDMKDAQYTAEELYLLDERIGIMLEDPDITESEAKARALFEIIQYRKGKEDDGI